jgi:hypothetical protein
VKRFRLLFLLVLVVLTGAVDHHAPRIMREPAGPTGGAPAGVVRVGEPPLKNAPIAVAPAVPVRAVKPPLKIGPIEGADADAVRAFQQRLDAEKGAVPWNLKTGGSTVAIDEEAGRVIRRDTAGKVEWSTRIGDKLERTWRLKLLTNGRLIYVIQESEAVTALDAATGLVVWHATGQYSCALLSGDLLLLAYYGPRVVALAAESGAEVFQLSLPVKHEYWPQAIENAAGLFMVGGFVFDRAGKLRHRIERHVAAMVPAGTDRLFLTSGDVRRITPDDRTVWSAPFESPEWISDGAITEAPDGDLLAILYGLISNSGVQVMRIDPRSGAVRWRTWCDPLSDVMHSQYKHDATAECFGDRVRVISRGSAGVFVEWLDGRTGARLGRSERRRW